jgi:hypothetical protein
MTAIQFGGEGKWRGEWGVKRGGKFGIVSERGWVVGAAAAHVRGGGGGAGSDFQRKKMAGRLIGWAHLSARGRWRGRLDWKGGGREVGRGWARN